jgi:hypothetical protein
MGEKTQGFSLKKLEAKAIKNLGHGLQFLWQNKICKAFAKNNID